MRCISYNLSTLHAVAKLGYKAKDQRRALSLIIDMCAGLKNYLEGEYPNVCHLRRNLLLLGPQERKDFHG